MSTLGMLKNWGRARGPDPWCWPKGSRPRVSIWWRLFKFCNLHSNFIYFFVMLLVVSLTVFVILLKSSDFFNFFRKAEALHFGAELQVSWMKYEVILRRARLHQTWTWGAGTWENVWLLLIKLCNRDYSYGTTFEVIRCFLYISGTLDKGLKRWDLSCTAMMPRQSYLFFSTCRQKLCKAVLLLKPGFHMSEKSQTIGDFSCCRPSQILPIYRIFARGLSQIFPITNLAGNGKCAKIENWTQM